jgi:hypothetical protein
MQSHGKGPMTVVEVISAPPRPAHPAEPALPALRRLAPSVIVIVGYLLIGMVAFWPVFPGISHRLFSVEADYAQSVWFLAWVPHALAHGLDPFFSNAIFVPTGVNLAQNTASPLLGLVTAPFAMVLSPVVRANLLMVLGMPVSATAAFVVLRRWGVWRPAAALGGLIYGFSPYMVGQSLAHVQLIFVPLPPFIALTVVSILQRQGKPRRLGIQLGLLVTAQYLISPEILTTVSICIIAAVACVAVRHPANVPALARSAARPVAIALAVTAVLLAYPVWMLINGPQHFTGSTWPLVNPFHNDLFSFVVPGPLQKVSFWMRALGTRLVGGYDPVESGGYIGVPLLMLSGILAWRSRRSPRSQLAVVVILVAALLSLGPHLAIDGRLTDIPLPFLVLDHIPLLNDIIPSRLCFEMGAGLAAVIAFGLDDLRRVPARGDQRGSARSHQAQRRRGAVSAGVTLVVVATLLPQWPTSGPYVAPPASALPAGLLRAVPAGDPVAIAYPYDTIYNMQPMLWQAEDGFDFRLLGGYAYHPDSVGRPYLFPLPMKPSGLQEFLAASEKVSEFGPPLAVTPKLVATTRTTLSKYAVRLVIVDRSVGGSGPVMGLFTDALGPPKVSAGQYSLWADWSSSTTTILRPAKGATLAGTTLLDATTGYSRVTSVEFLLTDRARHTTLIGVARLTTIGWLARWNTTGEANGTYTLHSVARDAAGKSSPGPGITITIKNH